jgi:hypothetical protein
MAHDGEAVIGSSAGTPFSSSFGNTIRESLKGDQAQKKASGGCRNGMEVSIHHALLVKMRLTPNTRPERHEMYNSTRYCASGTKNTWFQVA